MNTLQRLTTSIALLLCMGAAHALEIQPYTPAALADAVIRTFGFLPKPLNSTAPTASV